MLIIFTAGCQSETETKSDAPNQTTVSAAKHAQKAYAKKKTFELLEDNWFAFYMGGKKVGYEHTTWEKTQENNETLLVITRQSLLSVERDGQPIKLKSDIKSVETEDGYLVRFETVNQMGPQPIEYYGEVDLGNLVINTTQQNVPRQSHIKWLDRYNGFFGMERSFRHQPMKPGEQRTLELLLPLFHQVATVKLKAIQLEKITLLDKSGEYLKVETTLTLPTNDSQKSQQLKSEVWIDAEGKMVKMRDAQTQQESFRTTKEIALAPGKNGPFDIITAGMIPLKKQIAEAHRTKQIRYRITLSEGNPQQIFPNTSTQQVKSIDDHTIELTVRQIEKATLQDVTPENANWNENIQPPSKTDLEGNAFIQLDDERIQQLAEQIPTEDDLFALSEKLEGFVHSYVTKRNFSQGFATAADVAKNQQGDCTEHSVLLAALARVKKIPARVAIGLVYIEHPQPAFAYHMWNLFYLNDRWVPLDATLGKGGIGAAHIQLADTNLQGDSALTTFLPVAQIMQRVKIEVVEDGIEKNVGSSVSDAK